MLKERGRMKIGSKWKDLVGAEFELIATHGSRSWAKYQSGFVTQIDIANCVMIEESTQNRLYEAARALRDRLRVRIADDTTARAGERAALLEFDVIEAEIYKEEVLR